MVIRKRLVELDLTVSGLARRIGHPRSTVSRAIHGGRFPHVLQKILREIHG